MLHTIVVREEQKFFALEQEWNRLHRAAGGEISQTFLWLRRWWECYHRDSYRLEILTVWNDGSLVGVLPMFGETVRLGPLRIRRLRFLGIYEVYGMYAPLVHPDHASLVAPMMADFCAEELNNRRYDIVSFFRFSPASAFMTQLLNGLKQHPFHLRYDPTCIVRSVLQLPESWDAYVHHLSHGEREMLGRRIRSLARRGAEIEVVQEPCDEAFSDFVRLHTASWTIKGIDGYFRKSPKFEQFQRQVTLELMQAGHSKLYFFRKDGVRFAAVHVYLINETVCFYLSGLDRQYPLTRYSPGKVLLSRAIRDAIEGGYKYFDFQGGTEEYKFRLGGHRSGFANAVLWKKGASSLSVLSFMAIHSSYQFVREVFWKNAALPALRRMFRFFTPWKVR